MTLHDRAYIARDLLVAGSSDPSAQSDGDGDGDPSEHVRHRSPLQTGAQVIPLDFERVPSNFRVTRRNRAVLALGAVLRREGWYPLAAMEAAVKETQREDIAASNLVALQASAHLLG
jgi:Pyruvate/2-oxoacid:ferredoxin oxidoreductase gamma subunit